jgi:hypothetical protein
MGFVLVGLLLLLGLIGLYMIARVLAAGVSA